MCQATAHRERISRHPRPVAKATLLSMLAVGLASCGDDTTSSPPPTLVPTAHWISPTTAAAGSSDLSLAISGKDFGNQPHFRSQAVWSVRDTETPLATTFVSTTQLTAIIPAELLTSPDTAGILVETGDPAGDLPASRTAVIRFMVVAPPSPRISISPAMAEQGDSDLVVTIAGSGFGGTAQNRSQAVWSRNGNNTPLSTTFVSTTELTAIIPESLLTIAGVAQVFVQTGDPRGDLPLRETPSVSFQIIFPPLSISPSSAVQGDSDLVLTISGFGFKGGHIFRSEVVWSRDGVDTYLSTTFLSDTELAAVVPATLLSLAGTAQVSVQTRDVIENVRLGKTAAVSFQITVPPFSISPTSAKQGHSDLVLTISGSGFAGRPHYLSFVFWSRDGVDTYLSTTFVSDTKLTAKVPARLLRVAGTAQVFVETGDVMADVPLHRRAVGTFEIIPPQGTGTLIVYGHISTLGPRYKGYREVSLDASPWRGLGEGDSLIYSPVAAGNHVLVLSNPCTWSHQPSTENVTVAADDTVTVGVYIPPLCE